jgi:outer membrane lipoprotein-sorting protein
MATIANVVARATGRARTRHSKLAWTVPVLVAGAVAVGAAVTATTASGASPTLPARSPAQLLAAVQRSGATPLSGQLTLTANLGIPALPGDQSSASLSWQDFLAGSHSAKVWSDGPTRQRIALVGQLSEADVTHNGKDVWTYTSADNTVSHTVLANKKDSTHTPQVGDRTPAQLSTQLLKAIDPSTKVSVDTARRVAGRAAYTLVLRPRDARSTVREARIAIDATKFVPLRVQLFGSGSSPAMQVGFTSVSFRRPASSTFAFTRPAGASVTTDPLGGRGSDQRSHKRGNHAQPKPGAAGGAATPRSAGDTAVVGTGWTSVVETSGGAHGISLDNGLLNRLTTSTGSSGVRLLHTALVNAVFRPDGRVFAGAVSPALLEHIAATTR